MNARVIRAKAEKYASVTAPQPFDVVFIDPPYVFATEVCDRLLADLVRSGAAGDRTLIVLERSARSDDPTPPAGWSVSAQRDYGETAVVYIEFTEDAG